MSLRPDDECYPNHAYEFVEYRDGVRVDICGLCGIEREVEEDDRG